MGRVTPGSPAAQGWPGLGRCDRGIGRATRSAMQPSSSRLIARLKVGQRVPVAFVRNSQQLEATLDLTT